MLLSFLKKNAPSDVASLIEQNAAHLAEARAKLPALRDALDAASLRGTGDADAMAALRSAENEVARLEHRADALKRAKAEADAAADRDRVEAIRRKAVNAAGALDAKLIAYGKQAASLAALCAEIETLGDAVTSINAELEAAGASPAVHTDPTFTLRNVSLPHEADGPAYWTLAPRMSVSAGVLAMGR